MLKYRTKLYFAKGFKYLTEMAEKIKQAPKISHDKIEFSIRMFKKQLRGKIRCLNLKEEHCYGDLEISFCWKDHLRGKIIHPMTNCDEVFDE
jgi:hypothetical protein